jgi:hypothetical protein
MVPLVTDIHNAWADMVVPITRPVYCTTALLLTDNEVPYLGILGVLPNAGDARPTVDRFFVSLWIDSSSLDISKSRKSHFVQQKAMQIIRKWIHLI